MDYSQNRQRSRAGAPWRRASQQSEPHAGYDSSWVRSSSSQLHFLHSKRSIDTELAPVIDYAIRWAPFGGASAGELLVQFGVERRRFLEMVQAGLRLRRTDSQEVRWLKRGLVDALALAWRVDKVAGGGTAC
ncbi:hypothetical protein ABIA39_006298 [Nocardia sp. GAS34]|jgi:hypothetical protein|uniref:hypothetical protein n=1 Tax=unclassified Nocardia TaxID=2637762 RepID=UPI003D1B794A